MSESNTFIFTGLIIKETKQFSALCVELDVASEGETVKVAKSNLIEAVNLYLETAIENNLPVIRPVPQNENPLNIRQENIVESFKIKADLQVHVYA